MIDKFRSYKPRGMKSLQFLPVFVKKLKDNNFAAPHAAGATRVAHREVFPAAQRVQNDNADDRQPDLARRACARSSRS